MAALGSFTDKKKQYLQLHVLCNSTSDSNRANQKVELRCPTPHPYRLLPGCDGARQGYSCHHFASTLFPLLTSKL